MSKIVVSIGILVLVLVLVPCIRRYCTGTRRVRKRQRKSPKGLGFAFSKYSYQEVMSVRKNEVGTLVHSLQLHSSRHFIIAQYLLVRSVFSLFIYSQSEILCSISNHIIISYHTIPYHHIPSFKQRLLQYIICHDGSKNNGPGEVELHRWIGK